jgi:hypothetical protein
MSTKWPMFDSNSIGPSNRNRNTPPVHPNIRDIAPDLHIEKTTGFRTTVSTDDRPALDNAPEKGFIVRKSRTPRLIASITAAMFAAGLMVAPPAAADVDITPVSQTLVTITSGAWANTILCANPDDAYVRAGQDVNNPYCQWEQIGNDKQFTFFNPGKGMVLSGEGPGKSLFLTDLAFPASNAQNFSLGPAQPGGNRTVQWFGDPAQVIDLGTGEAPADGPALLGAWQNASQQTWTIKNVGSPAVPRVVRSAKSVLVKSNMWTDQVLCAIGDGSVKLSVSTQAPDCEWLVFGPQNGPFVIYNPMYGKVITYGGGTDGPLRVDDKTYPNDARELWAFGLDRVAGAPGLRWAADSTQYVDAGATAPTANAVRTRNWNSGNQQSMTWKLAPTAPQTATVTLGDSFMSGEAGRWQGNSNTETLSRDGTDRAYKGWGRYDPSRVYGSSYDDGCNRSDSAESHSSGVNEVQINLACSGAETVNIFRAANGGKVFKTEAPQADQLLVVAKQYDVRLIALSIGGNDLGFSDIIKACIDAYTFGKPACNPEQQNNLLKKLSATKLNVMKAITEIQATMTSAGYRPDRYKIVLQSAPSPIPAAAEIRYKEKTWERWHTGGCPFWNADANWARDKLVGEISSLLKSAADDTRVGFLDLQNAFTDREVCSTASQLVDPKNPPNPVLSEWARFLVTGAVQGQQQESFHPNYYGQLALGRCLALYSTFGQNASCRNTRGAGPEGMFLDRI